jgi:hypothetical protein
MTSYQTVIRYILGVSIGVVIFGSGNLFAYESDRYNRRTSEDDRYLSVAGGISTPSVTSALGQNPAGLVYNNQPKVFLDVASGNDKFNPIGYGGGFFTGNGSVGGGIALQGFNSQYDNSAGNLLLLNWGLAAEFTDLNLAWGFTGTYTLANTGVGQGTGSGGTGSGHAWGLDTGVIFNPHGSTRVGLTAFQVIGGVDAWGAGISYDPSPWATFTVDGIYAVNSKTTILKPALSIHVSGFALTSAYGHRFDGSGWGWMSEGLSLGVGFPLGYKWAIQGYYNQISKYFVGLTIAF